MFDALNTQEGGFDQVVTDAGGRGLHQHLQRVPQDGDCGGEDQDGEDEGADGVNDGPVRFEVDDDRCSEHSERLEEVTDHMDECCLDIDVLLVSIMSVTMFSIMTTSSSMTVTMLMKTGSHDDVDQDPQTRGDQHHLRLDLKLPGHQPDDCHVHQDPRHHPDHQHRDYRSQHLCSVPTKRHLLTLGSG